MRKQTPTGGEFKRNRVMEQNENMLKVEQQQQQKEKASLKTQMSTMSRESSQQQAGNSRKSHLVKHNNTPSGDGLFCVVKEENYFEPSKYEQFAEKVVNKKTKVVDNKIESTVIEALQKQCEDLGIELEKQNAQMKEKTIENIQLKQLIDKLNKTINEQMTEIMHLRNSNRQGEEQQESLKDKYNSIQRELSKLQEDYNEEQEKAETFKQYYNELKQESEEKIQTLQDKIKKLNQYSDELVEENEDLLNKMQVKQQLHNKINNERAQKFNDQTVKQMTETERKLEKMGKILEENAVMQEKLGESEILRKKFMEKNQLLDKEIRKLAQEKLETEKQLVLVQKRNKDLSVMKSTGNKVLDEKIKTLSDQLENANKEILVLNKKLKQKNKSQNNYQNEEDEEEIQEVQAKPYLFGPIDNGKF